MKIKVASLRKIIREELNRVILQEQDSAEMEDALGNLEMVAGGLEVSGDPVMAHVGTGLGKVAAALSDDGSISGASEDFRKAANAVPKKNPPVVVVADTGEVAGCDADSDAGMCVVPEDPGLTADMMTELGRLMTDALNALLNPQTPSYLKDKNSRLLLNQLGIVLARVATGEATHRSLRSNLQNVARMAAASRPAVGKAPRP
jgi:hypothetical protein